MPPRKRPVTLVDTVASGDRVAALRSLRDLLAAAIAVPDVAARDLAALSRQLTAVLAEIANLAPPVEVKGSPLDELNRRRVARGAAPAREAPAARG